MQILLCRADVEREGKECGKHRETGADGQRRAQRIEVEVIEDVHFALLAVLSETQSITMATSGEIDDKGWRIDTGSSCRALKRWTRRASMILRIRQKNL